MQFPQHIFYDIPYRALVPVRNDNLLVAGRCLSADFMAQSGCRLIMCCLTMGESAGTAAAMSLQDNVRPRDLDVRALQRRLDANGVNIGRKMRTIPNLAG